MQKPWHDETSTIHAFPRCFGYLKSMGVNPDKHKLSDYYAAVILSEVGEDVDFERHSVDYMKDSGSRLLGVIEWMLGDQRKKKPDSNFSTKSSRANLTVSEQIQLMAFLGARGVKTSKLTSESDVCEA